MSRANKSVQRAKAKKEAARRASARMKWAQHEGEVAACYVNENWRENGMAMVYLLRQLPGGLFACGCFLVDTLCFGLKDAWGISQTTMTEFREKVLDNVPEDTSLKRCDLDFAQRLVLGGVAHAQRNGFRLPKKHERWVRMVGPLESVALADTSDFGRNGRLIYIGSVDELHERLVGSSFNEFLQRTDVEVEFTGMMRHPDALPLDDGLSEDEFMQLVDGLVGAVRRWSFANGRAPQPFLGEMAEQLLDAILYTMEDAEAATLGEQHLEQSFGMVSSYIEDAPKSDQGGMNEAMEQILAFMESLKDEQAFLDATGMAKMLGGK